MMFDPALLSALHNADNFLLCAHINPDGDAIGRMLSTGRLLRKLGKTVTMVCPDPVPIQLNWLPDVDLILPVEAAESRRIDAALCVDVSEPKRMGSAWTFYERAPLRLVIDHHPAQADYAQYAHINTDAPAVGELIFALWGEMGVALDREAAAQLYAAISTDTGNFCFDNVRPSTFACMEKLMSLGLDLAQASRRLFLVKTRAAWRRWAGRCPPCAITAGAWPPACASPPGTRRNAGPRTAICTAWSIRGSISRVCA